MYALLFILVVFISINYDEATKVNIETTLPLKDVYSIFNAEELWGLEFVNTSSNLAKVNVVIEESKYQSLKSNKPSKMTRMNIIYSNVEEILKQFYNELNNRIIFKKGDSLNEFFDNYRNWVEYEAFITTFMAQYGGQDGIASISNIGQTIEGADIPLITLSGEGGTSNKPGFYIQAELHAREWLANAALMWIMNQLAVDYANQDETVRNIIDNINIYIVPTVNIDGYKYSWESPNNRYWRKNRRNNGDGTFGVDLNRNYDGPFWCSVGSGGPASDTYCGTAPFSENETIATRDFILDESNNIQAVFDMHTAGPLVLWPYGYTDQAPPDVAFFEEYGSILQEAVHDVNGHIYTSQQMGSVDQAAGSCSDWTYGRLGMLNSITFEGRGPGFDPPASNIVFAGQEQFNAIIVAAQRLL